MATPSLHLYAIAVGSNQRHHMLGAPRRIIDATAQRLEQCGIEIVARAEVFSTAPLGPSRRHFANTAWLIRTEHSPRELLAVLQATERQFGRRRRGARWAARTLDLDIILWSGGVYADPALAIPHPAWRQRCFVVGPIAQIAGGWRDPVSGSSVRHIFARLRRAKALPDD